MKKLAFFLLLTVLLQGAAYAGCCGGGDKDKAMCSAEDKACPKTNFVPANKK